MVRESDTGPGDGHAARRGEDPVGAHPDPADPTDLTPADAAADGQLDRFRILVDSIDQGYCEVEVRFGADGRAEDYRFIETNAVFDQQTGLTGAAGRWMRDLAPAHEDFWFETYGAVARTGETAHFTHEAKALGRWFDVDAYRLGTGPNRVGVLFRDVTARMRADQAQQDFIAMVSHDLATPISVIRARGQIMQRRARYDEAGVAVILDQARRMTAMLSDLRDAIRVGGPGPSLRRTPTDLARVVDAAVERARLASETHGPGQAHAGHVFSVMSPEGGVTGAWDEDRLAQVLDNLLSNAVKYAPPSEVIDVSVEVAGDVARIAVADRGPGIPEAALPHLFDRFYRVDPDGTTPGMGLGLYIVRALVHAHDGRIHAEARPGGGSVFVVELPIRTVGAVTDAALA